MRGELLGPSTESTMLEPYRLCRRFSKKKHKEAKSAERIEPFPDVRDCDFWGRNEQRAFLHIASIKTTSDPNNAQ
jgi:hypothetical protein